MISLKKINSLANLEVKFAIKLQEKKYRYLHKMFLVQGWKEIELASQSNLLLKVFVLEADVEKVNKMNVEINVVSESVLNKISPLNVKSKIVGIASMPFLKNLNYFLKSEKLVLLDNIQDPGNLGTIIRLCRSFGFDLVYSGVDLYNSKVISATKGSIFFTNILRLNNLKEFFIQKKHEQKIIGAIVDLNASFLHNFKVKNEQKYALVFGNEGNGISKEIQKYLDSKLFIKIDFESLNIATAVAIFANHFVNITEKRQ